MPRIPTVTIKADNKKGRKIINESDFDPEVHKLHKESSKEEEQEENTDENKETEEQKGAFVKKETKEGSNWFNVFDAKGNQVSEKALREDEADKLIETLG